jgi:Domain of unknown function (DUF4123)
LATTSSATCHERVLAVLRQPGGTLYGLIDAAQDPEILALIQEGGCRFESLYQGESAFVMASVAPYLVQLGPDEPLLDQLVLRGWGYNWGIYVRSHSPLLEMRRHFRQFTMVQLPEGEPAYFRFYDPRVFRVFMPTCNRDEYCKIFDKIQSILVENPQEASANRYSLDKAGRLMIETIL